MINRKVRWIAVLVILLVIVCRVAACGKRPEEITATGPHTPTEPAPPISYSEVTKIHFNEIFGGFFQIDVIVTKDKIRYQLFKQDVLRECEPEVINGTFECGQNVWDELLSALDDNHVNAWKEQGYYLNQCFNQQANLFVEWLEAEFVEEGDFFNITCTRIRFSIS